MEKAFYLRYRPQKIAELDLIDVREGLLKIVKSGKVPHALLFTGPRGTGKTSAARIIAKVVNCERGFYTSEVEGPRRRRGDTSEVKYEPCNRCKACQEITAGTALDLIEIDAASHTGVDNIRDLREKVKLAPTRMRNKVYIIDEVHMLSRGAFNALLKTLEEPPANTIFILCTTAPEKLPETIISRCTRFNFRKAKVEEVINCLERVIKGEKLKVEKGVFEEIAKSVDGSFRDGQKILDQLSSGRKKIALAETKKLLGKIEALSPGKLLSFLAEKKFKESLLEIDRIVTIGGDLVAYNQELLDRLRLGLLAKAGLSEISEPEETHDFNLEQIRLLIELFSRAARAIRTNPIPQLPLELAVVEWCERKHLRGEAENEPGGHLGGGTQRKSSQTSSGSPRPKKRSLNEIRSRWNEVLAGIRPLNHSVEALLRATRPIKINGDVLTLEVFYRFHKERLEEDKCRRVVEEVATQVLGRPIKLRCVLGERGNAKAQNPPGAETLKPSGSGQAQKNSDIIKAAEEIFGVDTN